VDFHSVARANHRGAGTENAVACEKGKYQVWDLQRLRAAVVRCSSSQFLTAGKIRTNDRPASVLLKVTKA